MDENGIECFTVDQVGTEQLSDLSALPKKGNNLSEMKMPLPIRKRGRPKGLENTVIGLPKKRRILGKVLFKRLKYRE